MLSGYLCPDSFFIWGRIFMNKKLRADTNALAVASLVFGIIGLLISWTMVFNLPCACLTFMFALLSRGNKRKCGLAVAGTVMGILSLIVGVIVAISIANMAVQYFGNMLVDFDRILEEIRQLLQQAGIGGIL